MPLSDSHILIVEDEYLLARSLQNELEDAGAIIVGLAKSTQSALDRIRDASRIDVAILDLNLRGEEAFGVADALTARKIPFIFASGHDKHQTMLRYPDAINCMKPYRVAQIIRLLREVMERPQPS